MKRIICHWTAGTYNVSDLDKQHYHFIIDGAGKLHIGRFTPEDNKNTFDGKYAAHTRGCNTDSIGISLACMGNAVEQPFNAGKWPMKELQWKALVEHVAVLCKKYSIPVTDKTVLSHAEVEKNLSIKQRGKWDFTRLAFDLKVTGAKACGDKLRKEVTEKLKKETE